MYNRSEIVIITSTNNGINFPFRTSSEMVIANFKHLDDAKAALKGLIAAARPGTKMAVRYWYSQEDSYLVDTTVAKDVELDDPFDGVPADTGTV